jgi:small-conductance mechanosensitive channel
MPDWLTRLFEAPATATLAQIVVILLSTIVTAQLVRVIGRRLKQRVDQAEIKREHRGRLKTLVEAGQTVTYIIILIIAALMLLNTLHIDIGPVLAGAGLAGLALSLGAQTLIKDFIGGVLILSESQFAIGDVIAVGDVTGEVEDITLRVTYLRDVNGKQFIIPNGDIRQVANLTIKWARAVVKLNVDYRADIEQVVAALQAAADRTAADETIKSDLLEKPQVLGWLSFSDWAVQVTVMVKTLPGKQWGVERKLRQACLDSLHAAQIEVALPSQEIHLEKD